MPGAARGRSRSAVRPGPQAGAGRLPCTALSYPVCVLCLSFQIQKLCDRVASSTLLDDRRDAVRALKSLSKVRGQLPEQQREFQVALSGAVKKALFGVWARPLSVCLFSKQKYRLEVGIQAMEHLIHVLQTDR